MNIKNNILICVFFILTNFIYSEEFIFDVDKIQNPRQKDGTWVTVYGNYLNQDEINQINQEINNIEKETTVEIAVVVVPNTDGDIFLAAQSLFEEWGIGKKDENNGLLLLASMDEHLFRTHTGYGLESVFTDATCKLLQDQLIVPNFKKGEYGKGILEYLKKIHEIVKNPNYFIESVKKEHQRLIKEEEEKHQKYLKTKRIRSFSIINFFAAIFYIIGFILLVKIWIITLKNINKDHNKYSLIKKLDETGLIKRGFSLGIGILFIIGGIISFAGFFGTRLFTGKINLISFIVPGTGLFLIILLIILAVNKKKRAIMKWRTNPRICPECSAPMKKLNENEEDIYLEKGQIAEEDIKTMDYDVWICTKCKNKTIESFRAWKYFLYISCPKCNKIAAKQTGSKVIDHPSYTSTGTKRLDFLCLACNHRYNKFITLAQLTRSSSSGGGYSSSSSSYSSSSSSSSYSSSSSSSSFGGGSSGGGGATSSW